MAIFPIYKQYGIKNLIVSTYQAVSGTGKTAVEELEKQTSAYVKKQEIKKSVYPHQISFNAIPEIGSLSAELPGYYTEEVKMVNETRKILDEPELKISATCVRIPVFNGHSESITVQCGEKPDVKEVKKILSSFPGVKVIDEPEKSLYPVPLSASGKDEVFIGRIRENMAMENTLNIWAVSDNIRKGAALNAIQIAEKMIDMNLL